eukprot:s2019_g6.t1
MSCSLPARSTGKQDLLMLPPSPLTFAILSPHTFFDESEVRQKCVCVCVRARLPLLEFNRKRKLTSWSRTAVYGCVVLSMLRWPCSACYGRRMQARRSRFLALIGDFQVE